MANVQHNALTDPNLHEPKGIAAASDKQLYVSNGAGSGNWRHHPLGWGYYRDAYVTGGGVGQSITTTPSIWQIDGLGPKTNTTYLPPVIRGSGDLWDVATNKLTPIGEGDTYDIRIDMVVDAKTGGTPGQLTMEMDISGTGVYATRTTVFEHFWDLSKTAPYRVSVGVPIFTIAPFPANGAQFWLQVDSGSISITDSAIFINRNFDGAYY